MKNLLYLFLILIIVSNCTFKKVSKNHGVPFLKDMENKMKINETNKNDIINIMGQPSTKSKFNENIWIYIESQQTQSELKNFGKMKIYNNKILVLEIDEKGILKNKKLYSENDMNDINLSQKITKNIYQKDSFLYNFFSSMRQKVNDPLGQRAKKRKEISNQR